jgi:hypothetical protein
MRPIEMADHNHPPAGLDGLVRHWRREEMARRQDMCRARGAAIRTARDLRASIRAASEQAPMPGADGSASDLRAAARHWSRLHHQAMRTRHEAQAAAGELWRARGRLLETVRHRAALERACERRRDERRSRREHAQAAEGDELARAAHERLRRSEGG